MMVGERLANVLWTLVLDPRFHLAGFAPDHSKKEPSVVAVLLGVRGGVEPTRIQWSPC